MQHSDLDRQQLQRLTYKELCALFRALKSTKIGDMSGEYRALMLAQPDWLSTQMGNFLHSHFVNWQSKAFRPVSSTEGRGYNSFLSKQGVVQRYPMKTLLAPSRYDAEPAYQLVYAAYDSLCGRMNMVDEIRQINSRFYLGIGTWGFTQRQRQIGYPFLLEDIGAIYRGDIGRERANFSLNSKHIPAVISR